MGIWVLSDPVPPHFMSPSSKQQVMKGKKKLFIPPVCGCVSVCVNVSFAVNRALIALALQLGDFQSKKSLASTFSQVLKCVIILCISIDKFFVYKKKLQDRKNERKSEHQETAEVERQEDCTDQLGRVKLFTLETVILPYDKLLHSDNLDNQSVKSDR